MSKTTFEPKTKTMTIEGSAGETTSNNGAADAYDPSKSNYVEHGKNGWKALTIDYTSYTDDLATIASALGDEIAEATKTGGSLSGSTEIASNASQFGIQLKGVAAKAYENFFEAVEPPPAPNDFPKGSDLYVVRSNYVDYIQLCEERIGSAKDALLEAHKESVDIFNKDAQNAEIATIRQFIDKLEEAKSLAAKYLAPIDAEIVKMEASK